MDKKLSVISRIKNGILLIFSRFKKNAEAGFGEDKEQLIGRKEKSSEKKEEVLTSISEVLRKWLEFNEKMEKFDEMVEKDRKEILKDRKDISNKIIEGISGLEDEYDKRLKDLKTSIEEDYDNRLIDLKTSIIEELKGEKKEGAAFDFITSKEDLEKIRDLAETVKSKKKLEAVMKKPEELKGKIDKIEEIAGMNLSDISPDTLEEIKKAPLEKIRMIGDMGLINFSDTELSKVGLIMGIASSSPEKVKEKSEPNKKTVQLADPSRPVIDHSLIDNLKKCIDKINIQLSYNKGVKLLREGDFASAYECFEEITNLNKYLKGAWLNRGVALGKLGDVDREIVSYEKALNVDNDKSYEKALHNKKIAERKRRIKKKWKELLRRISI